MPSILERISSLLSVGQETDPTLITDKLRESIQSNLKDDEGIVHCIRNQRAFYNSKNFSEKNMFFSSRCILTDRRLLIIRNLDHYKLFREIHLPAVLDHRIEKSNDDLVITLKSSSAEDIIEFAKHALDHAHEFSQVLEQTIKQAREKYPVSTSGKPQKKCGNCGKLTDIEAKFCSDCGHKFS